jgi:hypothetical protein
MTALSSSLSATKLAQRAAYYALKKAVASNLVSKPDYCECCGTEEKKGSDGRSMLQPSFRDYSNPRDVVYLCAKCFCNKTPTFVVPA